MYPEVRLMNHMVVLFLFLGGISILFSRLAESIYIHSSNTAQGFPFLHIIVISCLLDNSHCNVWGDIVVVLICVFLVIRDVEHLFMYLSAIWMSSLEKTKQQHWFLCPFFNQTVLLLLLDWMGSLYILGINLLLSIGIVNIFSHIWVYFSLCCLFLFCFVLLYGSLLVWHRSSCWFLLLLLVLVVSERFSNIYLETSIPSNCQNSLLTVSYLNLNII